MKWIAIAILLTLSVCLNPIYADTNNAAVKVKWGYSGNIAPDQWGKLDPSFAVCANGKEQSPINITQKVRLATSALTIHYQPAPLTIMDNGTTELQLGQTQTIINDGHTIQVNFSDQASREFINWQGQAYRLVQFHIHAPSETTVQGKAFPLEIHFVHQGTNGHVAVLAVFVETGAANPALQAIIDHVPTVVGKEQTIPGAQIDPANLLPANHTYYSFAGSLTTPPCTEGLQWLVLATPITASPAQIIALGQAIHAPNARPTQPLNNRDITLSKLL
jgi:carbonic anhydrase